MSGHANQPWCNICETGIYVAGMLSGGMNMHVGSFGYDLAVQLQGEGSAAVGLRNGVIFTTLIWAVIVAAVAGIIT